VIDDANSVVATIPVSAQPNYLLYNPSNQDVYVSHVFSRTIEIISSTTNKVINTTDFGSGLGTPVQYDPANQEMYLANGTDYGSLVAVSSASNSVVGKISMGTHNEITDLVYDPDNQQMYALTTNTDGLVHINAVNSSNRVVRNVTMPAQPAFSSTSNAVYDPSNKELYLGDLTAGFFGGAYPVLAYNTSSNQISVALNASTYANDFAYNPSKGEIYAIGFYQRVLVLDSANNVVSTIPLSTKESLNFMVYNPGNQCVYIDSRSGAIAVIH